MKKSKTIAQLMVLAITATTVGTTLTPWAIYADAPTQKFARRNTVNLFVEGKITTVVAYNIDGRNYFRITDLCTALDMNVARYATDIAEDTTTSSSQRFDGTIETPPTQSTLNVGVRDILLYSSTGGDPTIASSFHLENQNYVKLADIVNTNYDDVTKTITVEKTLTRSQPTNNTKSDPALTEEVVYARMIALKETYPNGMPWTNDNQYLNGFGCVAFAYILRDAAFGNTPSRSHKDFNHIRVGDSIRINNDTHTVVVLHVDKEKVTVAEGNINAQREIPMDVIKSTGDYISTNYLD